MKRFLSLLSLVAILVCSSVAQQSSQSPIQAQVVVPRLIRFSGQLPGASGTVGITFTLHKGQQDNAALWIETQNVQLDSAGKYTVLLGITKPEGIPTDLFSSGEAQWLGIQVQGKSEQPRVLLVSVPYALRAAEADTLAGHAPAEFVTTDKLTSAVQQQMQAASTSTAETPVHKNTASRNSPTMDGATDFTDTTTNQVVLVTQNGTGAGLIANAGNNYALSGTSTNTAIYGSSNGATHATAAALEGVTTASQGRGIFGWANTTTGVNFGLYGQANSVSGTGIAAASTATSGATVGLEAQDNSPAGTAAVIQARGGGKIISGQSGSSNTERFAVDGSGNVTAAGGLTGSSATISSAVVGTVMNVYNTDATDGGTAIYAASDNLNGTGVWGAASNGEYAYGVWGESDGGVGVYGEFSGPSTVGGDFAGRGPGVWGDSGANPSIGVLGTTDYGNAGYFENNTPGYFTTWTYNKYASASGRGYALFAGGDGGGCTVDNSGNLSCSGTVVGAATTADHRALEMYGVQSTENWYEDAGSGKLENGAVTIHLDANFAQVANTSLAYQVFLTPKGDCKGLYVTNEGPGSFEVHELGGGTANVAFDYRIMAKRIGKETLRMQDVTGRQVANGAGAVRGVRAVHNATPGGNIRKRALRPTGLKSSESVKPGASTHHSGD